MNAYELAVHNLYNTDSITVTEIDFNNDGTAVTGVRDQDGNDITFNNDDISAELIITNAREKRADAYPELKEQLDKLYHDIDNGTLTTSGDFYTAINTVKTTYPKS